MARPAVTSASDVKATREDFEGDEGTVREGLPGDESFLALPGLKRWALDVPSGAARVMEAG